MTKRSLCTRVILLTMVFAVRATAEPDKPLVTLSGHTDSVKSVVFSPDGKRLASSSFDNTVKLWDAKTGKELLTLKGQTADLQGVAFSPDGKQIVRAGDEAVIISDPATGKDLHTFKIELGVHSVAFSADGKRIAAICDRKVKVWDAQSGKESFTSTEKDIVLSCAFSPDSKHLASAGLGDSIKLWDMATGSELRQIAGQTGAVESMAFGPDGKRLASANGEIRVWETATGRKLFVIKPPNLIRTKRVTFSPDGKRLATAAGEDGIDLWDASTGKALLSLDGNDKYTSFVAFSPDGNRLASGGGDKKILIWDVTPPNAGNP